MGWLDSAATNLAGFRGRFGLVSFGRVQIGDSPAGLREEIEVAVNGILERGATTPEEWVKGVRGLLKQSGFKPTGRSKPASEYLMRDLESSRQFKFINNLVDINNLLSLQSYLPMSVLDIGKFSGGLEIRVGAKGESYVFNPSGQELDLSLLLLAADKQADGTSKPMGTPIKDSQFAKLAPETTSAVVVVYAPVEMVSEAAMKKVLADWIRLGQAFAAAENCESRQIVA